MKEILKILSTRFLVVFGCTFMVTWWFFAYALLLSGVVATAFCFGILWYYSHAHEASVHSSKKVSSDMDSQEPEPDNRERTCTCYFAHDSLDGIEDYCNAESLPTFLKNSVQAHHWCLIFKFDNYKIVICELDFDNNCAIQGTYRVFESKDKKRYPTMLEVCTLQTSPARIWKAAVVDHPFRGDVYDLSGKSCQEWVLETAKSLKILPELETVITGERNQYKLANSLIDKTKTKISKLERAERAILSAALKEQLEKMFREVRVQRKPSSSSSHNIAHSDRNKALVGTMQK